VRLVFTSTAWKQYLGHTDRKLVKRIGKRDDVEIIACRYHYAAK
jgi:Txe/YoeB family toxin of Txe-Axe toxin-antitoxin module